MPWLPASVIAASLPIDLRCHLQRDLGDHRVDLAGHDRGALLQFGQEDLTDSGTRAGTHQCEVVGDLRERHRDDLERARELDQGVTVGLRLERVLGSGDLQTGRLRELCAHARRELGVGVEAGAGRGAAERNLRHLRQRDAHAASTEAHLCGVAGELLPERDGHRIHQMRAAGLDDVVKLGRLGCERALERVERRQQVICRLAERRQVHRGWEDIVGGLPHVDVVVGVGGGGGGRDQIREVGDDLVGVHVGRRSRARLEDVYRELVIELPVCDTVRGSRDAFGVTGVEQAEFGVDARRRCLDPTEPTDHRNRNRLAGDREVPDGLGGLAAPELLMLSRAHARPFTFFGSDERYRAGRHGGQARPPWR